MADSYSYNGVLPHGNLAVSPDQTEMPTDERRERFVCAAHVERSEGAQLKSRFEQICDCIPAASETTVRLLVILFAAGGVSDEPGCDTLCPLWAMEAIQRSHNFLRLALLGQQRIAPGQGDPLAIEAKLVVATRLADLYREIAKVPERRKVPCSRVLRSAVEDLVALFGRASRDINLATDIECVALPAVQRRALVLAATDLVASALLQVTDSSEQQLITVSLRIVDVDHACLTISDNGARSDARTYGGGGCIAGDMAGLLASGLVHQRFGRCGAIAKITFPLNV